MEQTARAVKPDIPMAILNNGIDLPNELAIAVIAIASEGFSGRIKFVQAAVYGANPEMAALSWAMLLTVSPLMLLGLSGLCR